MITNDAFPVEPWHVRETRLELDVLAQSESLFALSNGHLGLRGNLWGLEWLVIFVLFWSLQPLIIHLFSGVTAFSFSLALSTAMWVITPYLLVAKRIAWRRLVPQALLTALSLDALAIAGAIYLPHAVQTTSKEFGVLGVAFTLLSLLFAISLCLVGSAAIGATVGETFSDTGEPDLTPR